MTIDTDRTIDIAGSPVKLFGLAALGLFMTALGGALAFQVLPGSRAGTEGVIFGWLGLIFFGACTVVIAWRALTAGSVVVTLSPSGIKDVRVAADVIPWGAVQRISTWTLSRQKVMVLAVPADAEAALALTPMARWTRKANTALGADGLCITAQGLTMSFDKLLETTTAYAKAHGSPAAGV